MTKLAIYQKVRSALAELPQIIRDELDGVTKVNEATLSNLIKKVETHYTEITDEFLKPKGAGVTRKPLEEVTKCDEDGKFTEVLCSVSGVWLPATTEYFYEDKTGSSKILSADGESIAKRFKRVNLASQKSVTDDIMNVDMSSADAIEEIEELKKVLQELKEEKPDFSSVGVLTTKSEDFIQ